MKEQGEQENIKEVRRRVLKNIEDNVDNPDNIDLDKDDLLRIRGSILSYETTPTNTESEKEEIADKMINIKEAINKDGSLNDLDSLNIELSIKTLDSEPENN